MSNPAFPRPSFIPSVIYKDNCAALKWLQDAFGFEPSEVLTDADGNIVHAEMSHGDGVVMIGNEWADWTRSSFPAVSRHLRALRESGLVDEQRDALDSRVRIYQLRPQPMAELKAWLEQTENAWASQLGAFRQHVRKTRR